MGTVKLHLLYHLCDDIARNRCLYISNAGIYEVSHKNLSRIPTIQPLCGLHILFTKVFPSWNILYQWTMDQTKETQFITLHDDQDSILSVSKHRDAIEKDTGCMARPSTSLNSKEFTRTGKLAQAICAVKVHFDELKFVLHDELIKYAQEIGSNAYNTFVNLFEEVLVIDSNDGGITKSSPHAFCRSAHISGINPSMEDVVDRKEVHVIDSGSRKLQRIFAAYKFYGTGWSRFDSFKH